MACRECDITDNFQGWTCYHETRKEYKLPGSEDLEKALNAPIPPAETWQLQKELNKSKSVNQKLFDIVRLLLAP